MTYYEKYQTLLDEVTIKVIKGTTIPISFINEIKKSFEEWKSKTSLTMANKEVKTIVHEFK